MFIHDNHSLNKTYRNALQLKPDVHYALEGGETITLGEVTLRFHVVKQGDAGAAATAAPGATTSACEQQKQEEDQSKEKPSEDGTQQEPERPDLDVTQEAKAATGGQEEEKGNQR